MTDQKLRAPFQLGPLPVGRLLFQLDEAVVRAPLATIFDLAAQVEHWPAHLAHYRYVRFRSRTTDGGGTVEMSANRPFGPLNWPTYWCSYMSIDREASSVRYRHIEGVTTGMDVEWTFAAHAEGTHVRLFHVWDGPAWPLIRVPAATLVIGPVFVHGIAQRTLAGLKAVAERGARS